MGMDLFLCFFFMGLVNGVSSTTVVCEGYVPSVLVLFVMGKVWVLVLFCSSVMSFSRCSRFGSLLLGGLVWLWSMLVLVLCWVVLGVWR
jgi:hypothetical protein